MTDFDDLMKKVDYLVKINPATIPPPLSQLGKPALKPSYKYIPKEKARRDLLKLGREEIEKLYKEAISRQIKQREKEEKEHYFNQPYCDADFNHSGKKALWFIEEGITLILGKDPKKVKWEEIKRYNSPFVKKFEEIKELAKSYQNAGQLSDPTTPGEFLAWAERMGLDIPKELLEVINTLGIQIADWQTACKKVMEQRGERDKIIELLQNEINQLKTDIEQISKNELSLRAEETYLTILGVILVTMFTTTPGGQKISCFDNQSALITYLVDNFSSARGISKSTLEDKFAKAKKIEFS